jgi:hypothetical protein
MATSASRDTTTGTNYETEVENLLEEFSDHKVESQVWMQLMIMNTSLQQLLLPDLTKHGNGKNTIFLKTSVLK